jgi:hypothetical protein
VDLAVSCILGLLVGGVLGGLGVTLLQQIRAGRIKVPPEMRLGPVKLDLSGLGPRADAAPQTGAADWASMGPALEVGGSMTSGCLALTGAGLVLVGFVLPWFTCSIPLLMSGSVSGFSMLLQLVGGVLISGLGVLGGDDFAALSGALGLILVGVTAVLILIPFMGLRVGRMGLELIQSPRLSSHVRREASRTLIRAAIIGFIPMLCYLTSATAQFSGFGLMGLSVQSADRGLWVTLGGFGLAIVAGLVISTTAAWAEQLARPSSALTPSRPAAPVSTPATPVSQPPRPTQLTEEERQVLVLIAEGLSNVEIAERLNISPVNASLVTTELLSFFGVVNRVELAPVARARGFLPTPPLLGPTAD